MTMTQDAAVRAYSGSGVLRMAFQPIIDTARGTVVGYESLARFSGPPDATPDRWFAVADAGGAELEARALRIALESRSAGPGPPVRRRRRRRGRRRTRGRVWRLAGH